MSVEIPYIDVTLRLTITGAPHYVTLRIEPSGTTYRVWCPQFPAVATEGAGIENAIGNGIEAVAACAEQSGWQPDAHQESAQGVQR